jgi:hypothetical protein
MLQNIRQSKRGQLFIGLLIGVLLGFLFQRGGLTEYDVITGQLLLEDFTVVKVMLSASVTGMLLVHLTRGLGWVRLHPKPGSLGSSLVGGLIFGVAFAVLGLCPGTAAGAVGQGALDVLVGGVPGMLLGSWLFATFYPRLQKLLLTLGDFGPVTLPEVLKVKNVWVVVLPAAILLVGLLAVLEVAGL